jgi:hypothetical protein
MRVRGMKRWNKEINSEIEYLEKAMICDENPTFKRLT